MTGWQVLVHHRGPAVALVAAYRDANEALAGVPGFLGAWLLRAEADEDRFVLELAWDHEDSYRHWEAEHRRSGHPSALRPFQDRDRAGGHYETFEVVESRPRAGREPGR